MTETPRINSMNSLFVSHIYTSFFLGIGIFKNQKPFTFLGIVVNVMSSTYYRDIAIAFFKNEILHHSHIVLRDGIIRSCNVRLDSEWMCARTNREEAAAF